MNKLPIGFQNHPDNYAMTPEEMKPSKKTLDAQERMRNLRDAANAGHIIVTAGWGKNYGDPRPVYRINWQSDGERTFVGIWGTTRAELSGHVAEINERRKALNLNPLQLA